MRALDALDVTFPRGQLTAIMGPSGSGKSTLMHCVAGLDTASGGAVWVGDTEITALSDKALTELRRDRIGFIFQSFNLLPTLSAAENITLPMDIAGRTPNPAWLDRIIETVGLRERLTHRPGELSGGQQQRVACARALAARPELIFADEPTGNLDSHAAAEMLGFLRRTVDELGQTLVMVTHAAAAAAYADRVLFLTDGRIVDELTAPTTHTVLETMTRLEGPAANPLPRRAGSPGETQQEVHPPAVAASADPGRDRSAPGAGTGGRLAEAWHSAQAARDHLDRLVGELAALSHSVTGFDAADDSEMQPARADHGGHAELEAALAGERTRRQAAEAASGRAAAALDAMHVELAHTRAAAMAALELAAARAEQQLTEARSAHERWQAEIDAAHRDRELVPGARAGLIRRCCAQVCETSWPI